MAKFKINDWVQITPKRDYKWSDWSESHSDFCGRIGYIEDIEASPDASEDEEEDMIKVTVYFGDNTFNKPGYYYTLFKRRHLILATNAQGNQYENDEEALQETTNFEDFTKKKRDEIFKYMFSTQEEREKNNIRKIEEEQSKDLWDEETTSDWDLKTPPTFI